MSWSIILVVALLTLGGIVARRRGAERRRGRLMTQPLPAAWVDLLERNIPTYRRLPPPLKSHLHGLMNVFLDEKRFEGCGGLELTDEIRVTIAAEACMLLLGRPGRIYPRLQAILVYPSAYRARKKGLFGENDSPDIRLGESWSSGAVVLSWDDVLHGGMDSYDGTNVVLHEFAHQLDQEDGAGDGVPLLESRSAYRAWARVFNKEYGILQQAARTGRRSDLNEYGATNPAEFFAVVSETFFEKPRSLHRRHPELYEELQSYYHVDPRTW